VTSSASCSSRLMTPALMAMRLRILHARAERLGGVMDEIGVLLEELEEFSSRGNKFMSLHRVTDLNSGETEEADNFRHGPREPKFRRRSADKEVSGSDFSMAGQEVDNMRRADCHI